MEKAVPRGAIDEKKKRPFSDKKKLLIILLVIAVVLAVASSSLSFLKFAKAPQKYPVDKLHELNKQGKLSPERGYMYGSHSVVKDEGLWWTDLYFFGKEYKVPLHFGPREVENVSVSGEINESFNSQPDVFVAIDPAVANKYYSLALSELSVNLAKIMNRAPIGSCTKKDPQCDDREIISCEKANGRPVIELALGGTPSIELQGSCIKVSGEEYGITRAVDRLLYRWYGVMK